MVTESKDAGHDACGLLSAMLAEVARASGRTPVFNGESLTCGEAFAADGLLPTVFLKAAAGFCSPALALLFKGIDVADDGGGLAGLSARPDGEPLSAVAALFAASALLDAAGQSPAGAIDMGWFFRPAGTLSELEIENAELAREGR